MPLRYDNDIRATSLHFLSARQQPPNIDIQCLGPDWQRPAWRDPHKPRNCAPGGGRRECTSPWRLSNEFQCGSSKPRALMWFLAHSHKCEFTQCALGLMWSPDVGSCCTHWANHAPWMSLITAWVTFNLLRRSLLFCRWCLMLTYAYKMMKSLLMFAVRQMFLWV